MAIESNEADRSTVTQLLGTLPYRQRQVLVLRYFVDYDRSPDRVRARGQPRLGQDPRLARPRRPGPSIGRFAMTGREDDVGRTLRSLLLEETNAMPVDTHHAARRPPAPDCRHSQAPASHSGRRRFGRRRRGQSPWRSGVGSVSTRPTTRPRTQTSPRQSPESSSMRSAASTPTRATQLPEPPMPSFRASHRGGLGPPPEQLRLTIAY